MMTNGQVLAVWIIGVIFAIGVLAAIVTKLGGSIDKDEDDKP